MIDIQLLEVQGMPSAIYGMRNPKNSWDKSDSHFTYMENLPITVNEGDYTSVSIDFNTRFDLGPNDLDLAERLVKGGPVHAKFRRMIIVYADIIAPLYWWKEFDTYKVGTVANSCSTMHKIHAKEFEPADFSADKLTHESMACLNTTLAFLNENRRKFLETKDKEYWWQMIQLLPSSYNQKRTVMMSYEVLANIYEWRKDHKLDEWQKFCHWIAKLPYSEQLILCSTDL